MGGSNGWYKRNGGVGSWVLFDEKDRVFYLEMCKKVKGFVVFCYFVFEFGMLRIELGYYYFILFLFYV